MIDGYITVNETANRWNLKPRTVQIMCADGKIEGAVKFGKAWAIPAEAVNPTDGREKSGIYIVWRKKKDD